jgi:RimJ/RimL family protein N-acetyltransferase
MTEIHHAFLVGAQVYLRRLEPADLHGDYFQWLNDTEVTRYLESGRFPNSSSAMEAYYAANSDSTRDVFLAIVDRDSDRMIGTCRLGSINWIHRHAEFGILIGDKSWWGKGVSTEVTRLLVAYAFRQLNLHRVWLGVVADHEAAIKSYERAGFIREGVIRDFLYVEGSYRDKLFMSVSRAEFDAAMQAVAHQEAR